MQLYTYSIVVNSLQARNIILVHNGSLYRATTHVVSMKHFTPIVLQAASRWSQL